MKFSRFSGWAVLALSALAVISGLQSSAYAQSDAEIENLLALNLYHEARQEGRDGMVAVGWVVLNRVTDATYPDSVYGVITQGGETPPCQFGWRCDGKSDATDEEERWQEAQAIARELLSDNKPVDPTSGALFFWESWRDTPGWAQGKIEGTATIGGNSFFKLK